MPPHSPETPEAGAVRWRPTAASALAVSILLAGLGWARWQGPAMSRPLGYDEFLTLEYYTWVGAAPSGEARPLRRIEDYHDLGAPGGRQFAVGIYRSLGIWKEPNNHVLNSAMVGLALATGRTEESTARLPAFLGAVIFAATFYWLCGPVLGWTHAAPLAAIWAFCNPYVVNWGQTARGYSWTLALQALLFLGLYRLASRPGSIWRGAACAALAILTFVNVVNLAADWLLPIYVAFWLLPPWSDRQSDSLPVDTRTWRRNLLVQGLCILAVGGVFLIDRLPYVYSSARQYGVPLSDSYRLANGLVDIAEQLFPGPIWGAFGAFGLVGIAAMAASRARPVATLGGAGLATVVVGLLHFGLAGRIPYPRTCGYFMPIVLMGASYLVERAVCVARSQSAGAPAWLAAAIATAMLALIGIRSRPPTELDVEALRSAADRATSTAACAMLPTNIDYLVGKYLPRDWSDTTEVATGSEFDLALLERWDNGWRVEMLQGEGGGRRWRAIDGLGGNDAAGGPYRFGVIRVASRPLSVVDPDRARLPAVVLWRPYPARLGLDAGELMAFVGRSGVPYIRRDARVFTKLDFNGQLHSLEFVACTTAELETITGLIEGGASRFGGSALILEPTRPPTPP